LSRLIVVRVDPNCKWDLAYTEGVRGVAMSAVVGLAALVAAVSSHASGTPTATASLSTTRAGAHPVALTLRFDAVYFCGQARGAVTVTLPKGESLPSSVMPAAVRLDGHAAASATVSGRTVTVAPPSSAGKVTCNSIRLGTEVVTFTPAAGLANPKAAGRYSIVIKHGTTSVSAPITIR